MNPSNSLLKVKMLKFIKKTRKDLSPNQLCETCKVLVSKHSDEDLLKCFIIGLGLHKELGLFVKDGTIYRNGKT